MISRGEVGTKKIFEDERVIIWELFLEPGEVIELHTHQHDYFFYVFEGGTIHAFDADDNHTATLELSAGDTVAFRHEGKELVPMTSGDPPIPSTHWARNAGETRYREILVEMKN
ncbi:MAG: hypothetical protein AAEJ52_08475 [Myxococcota bacterium]